MENVNPIFFSFTIEPITKYVLDALTSVHLTNLMSYIIFPVSAANSFSFIENSV